MIFRASSMPRLVPCPGSHLLGLKYPDESGEEATEGDVAHEVSADSISTGNPLSSYVGQSRHGVLVDQEMIFHLELYVRECMKLPGDRTLEFQYNTLIDGHTVSGSPDCWGCDAETLTLHVKDLKYGFGWVEEYMNWQLLTYAMLILDTHPKLWDMVKRVCLTIIQPRASHPRGPVREWNFDVDLMRNYRNHIVGAVRDAVMPEPKTVSGPHCRYDPALLECHAATSAAGFAVDYSCKAGVSTPTPEQFARDIAITERAKKMLDQRMVALEEVGLNMCKSGTNIPGWEARQTVGALQWRKDKDVVKIAAAMKKDIKAPQKPITATQAVQRGLLPEAVVKTMAARSTGGVKLKRVDLARARKILNG